MILYDPQPYGESAGLPPEATFRPQQEEKPSLNAEQIKQQALQKRDEVTQAVKSRASQYFDQQKETLAEAIQDVSTATKHCGDELRQNHPQIGEWTNVLAGQMDDFSNLLRRRDAGYIMESTQSLARRHPGLFLGGALLVGFAAVRFLKSSRQVQEMGPSLSTSTSQEPFGTGTHEERPVISGTQYVV